MDDIISAYLAPVTMEIESHHPVNDRNSTGIMDLVLDH